MDVFNPQGIFEAFSQEVSFRWGSEFSSYEIELRDRVTQNDVTFRVINSESFSEILLSSY